MADGRWLYPFESDVIQRVPDPSPSVERLADETNNLMCRTVLIRQGVPTSAAEYFLITNPPALPASHAFSRPMQTPSLPMYPSVMEPCHVQRTQTLRSDLTLSTYFSRTGYIATPDSRFFNPTPPVLTIHMGGMNCSPLLFGLLLEWYHGVIMPFILWSFIAVDQNEMATSGRGAGGVAPLFISHFLSQNGESSAVLRTITDIQECYNDVTSYSPY